MQPRFPRRLAWLTFAATLPLAGCGTKHVLPPPTPTVVLTPAATPIPQTLVTYANAVTPVLTSSISEANGVVHSMQTTALPSVGNICSTVGGDLVNSQLTVRSMYTPGPAQIVYHSANTGYKRILLGMDECGIASDAQDRSEFRRALSDVKTGVYYLKRANSSAQQWRPPAA